MKFLLYTDLHYDFMPKGDRDRRLEDIVRAAQEEKVDFAVCLGDLAKPVEENRHVYTQIQRMGVPHYIALGNHDMDFNDKSAFLRFYGMERSYYSVDTADYLLIFLDTNYFRLHGIDYDYGHANYYPYPREYLSREELRWFADTVRGTQKPCLLFSHALLFQGNDQGGCGNYLELHDMISGLNAEAGWKKICASFNGHNHTNSHLLWDGVHYFDMNSASYVYVGEDSCELPPPRPEYNSEGWSSLLKVMMPYTDTLYAIVTLEDQKLKIAGKRGGYIGGGPAERKHQGTVSNIPITAAIDDWEVSL